ncbi:MAG: fumarylacetoacetate hydrolase family protein [Burkholderiales bacterium]|nr:fumarylacetoacetate hydrolase family protein [Burkholderiales bacterium]
MTTPAQAAAATLWRHWQAGTRLAALPPECRPLDRAQGYAAQAAFAALSGEAVAGWKIAATSSAGQQHIGVDGPLAGRLLASRLLPPGATVRLANNQMRVMEAEFAFRLGADLAPRAAPYEQSEVLAAVAALHPAIEIPDSRYDDFVSAGAPQLIADCACACWLVVGAAMPERWRTLDLAAHAVTVWRGAAEAARGQGANVLGDPRIALTWIANELSRHGPGLKAGDLVTTGTCVVPVPVEAGDRMRADYGVLGSLEAALV